MTLSLPDNDTPTEMFALDKNLNNLKGHLFNSATTQFTLNKDVTINFLRLSEWAALLLYMQNPAVINAFKATSLRMQNTLRILDTDLHAAGLNPDPINGNYFELQYLNFMGILLPNVGSLGGRSMQVVIDAISRQLTPRQASGDAKADLMLKELGRLTSPGALASTAGWASIAQLYAI